MLGQADLENLTHSETPWQSANRIRRPGGRATIRLARITDYFATEGCPTTDDEGL